MKTEAQRIAIAEWCGWKQIKETGIWHDDSTHRNAIPKDGKIFNKRKEMKLPSDHFLLPDYLNDLNAMHEAELHSFKTVFERVEYRRHLENVASRTREPDEEHVIDSMETWAMFATAAQRAEALLRTIGKWTDSTLHTKG